MERKSNAGRKSKMPKFIEALNKVLNENPRDAVIMTDEELRYMCNELLDEGDQISKRTFISRKNGEEESEEYYQFLHLYKKALLRQKRELFQKLETDDKSRQRFAWIFERKFDEWNLRKISEVDNKISGELSAKVVMLPPIDEEDNEGENHLSDT